MGTPPIRLHLIILPYMGLNYFTNKENSAIAEPLGEVRAVVELIL